MCVMRHASGFQGREVAVLAPRTQPEPSKAAVIRRWSDVTSLGVSNRRPDSPETGQTLRARTRDDKKSGRAHLLDNEADLLRVIYGEDNPLRVLIARG
jgi:hypothetical protein